jgi:hypothetical protein
MNSGRFILTQILDLVNRKMLSRLVERYAAESRVRRDHLSDDRNPSQATQAARNTPQIFVAFERSYFRESASK